MRDLLTRETRMTIAEVVSVLGVSERTIWNAIQALRKSADTCALFPSAKRGRGQEYLLSEQQVTLISQKVKQAHNSGLAISGNKDSITTRQERLLVVQQAMNILIEENQQLEHEKAELKERNQNLEEQRERLAKSSGNVSITMAAKELGMNPGQLFDWLEQKHWIYRRGNVWTAMQEKIDSGLLSQSGGEKNGHHWQQVKVTPKGISRLLEKTGEKKVCIA